MEGKDSMGKLEKLKSGYQFRNSAFADKGVRYKLRLGAFGVYDIVQVGDEYFDLQGHTSPHYVKSFDGDTVTCGHVMREMSSEGFRLSLLLSDLVFDDPMCEQDTREQV